MASNLSVREIRQSDVDLIVSYWYNAEPAFLTGMGVDLEKVPPKQLLTDYLTDPISKPYHEKDTYCMIWLINGKPSGHSNVNKIIFGEEASMHLHLWNDEARNKGYGAELVKMTLPYFFNNLKLKKVYSEPYALNPAPNTTLKKAGFELVKNYITTPGWINFEQPVNRWEMSYERFKSFLPLATAT